MKKTKKNILQNAKKILKKFQKTLDKKIKICYNASVKIKREVKNMNIKITKKDLNYNFYYIVKGGYCEFQHLTRYAREIGYARGIYGWNWTAYSITASNGEEVVICTGYRDMTGKRLDGLKQFEDMARKLAFDTKNYDESVKKQRENLTAFADYVVKHYNED